MHYRIARVAQCSDCGGVRRMHGATTSPHGVRWARVNGIYAKVDCVGRVVDR